MGADERQAEADGKKGLYQIEPGGDLQLDRSLRY